MTTALNQRRRLLGPLQYFSGAYGIHLNVDSNGALVIERDPSVPPVAISAAVLLGRPTAGGAEGVRLARPEGYNELHVRNGTDGAWATAAVDDLLVGGSHVRIGSAYASRMRLRNYNDDAFAELEMGELLATGGYRQLLEGWYRDDVPASLALSNMTRRGGSVGTAYPNEVVAARAGSVTGIAVKSNANFTAGNITISVAISGVTQSLNVQLTTGENFKATLTAKDNFPFVAGDRIGAVHQSSAGLTPVTNDISVVIEMET